MNEMGKTDTVVQPQSSLLELKKMFFLYLPVCIGGYIVFRVLIVLPLWFSSSTEQLSVLRIIFIILGVGALAVVVLGAVRAPRWVEKPIHVHYRHWAPAFFATLVILGSIGGHLVASAKINSNLALEKVKAHFEKETAEYKMGRNAQ
jgi:hypothetical protein